jgi:hypothetical protein
MPSYEVVGSTTNLRVEGDNWLSALGASLEYFGLDSGAVARLSLDVRPDGIVAVLDPVSGKGFELRPAEVLAPAAIDMNAVARPAVLELDEASLSEALVDAPPPVAAPPPGLVMPGQSLVDDAPPPPPPEPRLLRAEHSPTLPPIAATPDDDRPEDLAEMLFDLSFDIMVAESIPDACRLALRQLHELVSSEAGAVLYSDINSVGLSFMSAFGPASEQLVGKTISFETGVAGFCHQHGVGLVLQDTTRDARHDKSVDQAVGFQTRSLLAAPIISPGGHTYGCLELLNAPERFSDWHLEAAQGIASALGDFVNRHEGR